MSEGERSEMSGGISPERQTAAWCPGCGQSVVVNERHDCPHDQWLEQDADSSVEDVLVRAADLLEEFGWRQGHVGSKSQGVFCALGAINEATRDLGASASTRNRAKKRLANALGRPVAHWNDAVERRRVEVVAKLREVARG